MGPSRKTLRGARLPRHRASNVALCQRSCIHRQKVKRLIWKCFHFWRLPSATSLRMGSKSWGCGGRFSAISWVCNHTPWPGEPGFTRVGSSNLLPSSLLQPALLQQTGSIFWWQNTGTCLFTVQTWWAHGDQGFCFNWQIQCLTPTLIFNTVYTYGVPWNLFPHHSLNSLSFPFCHVHFFSKVNVTEQKAGVRQKS